MRMHAFVFTPLPQMLESVLAQDRDLYVSTRGR